MTEPNFTVSDRRHSPMRRSASGLYVGNADAEMHNLRARGYTLPTSGTQARIEAKRVVTDVRERGTVADVQNRAMAASMRQERFARASSRMSSGGGMQRTGANVQMVLPKVRQPLSSLMDKGIPFNVQDAHELTELRRWCNSPSAPVWMGDYSFKPIGEIGVGDQVIGWDTHEDQWRSGRRELVRTTVLAVHRRVAPEVVKITFASGRTVECTPDHEWLRYYVPGADGRILNSSTNPERSWSKRYDSEYAPLRIGSIARSVIVPTQDLNDLEQVKAASWLAGIIDGEGSWSKTSVRICQSEKHNPHIVARIDEALELLGMTYRRHVTTRNDPRSGSGHHGGGDQMVRWDLCRGIKGDRSGKNRQQLIDLYNWAQPAKFDREHMDAAFLTKNFGEPDQVVSIESLGSGEVVSMQTTTGNYTAWGYASRNCRLFYSTHPLVPLLVDIYSKFPVTGLEFVSKDPKIEEFYESMFMDDLNYDEFLPDGLMREYFMVGEVSALAHFNEQLGIWSSEEILNPDMVRVSKSLFVEQERVQLLVKDLVETLRNGPEGMSPSEESPSERYERQWEYQQLVKHYPEIIKAAMQDDGLDISDALVSRMVNKAAWWDLRGTPHLLRSFRTLMLEESLNAAQDAICQIAETPVLTSTGVSYIEDVKVGDNVLTHRGRYQKVLRTMKRDADEPGVTIRWWYDRPLTLTGKHPVYVRRPVNRPVRYNMQNHTEWVEGFIPACEVQVYDQVLHPSSPDSGKGYVSIWEHLDQSDWVVYDPADEAFGMTGHAWYDQAATQTRRVARNRVRTVLSTVEASPGDIIRDNRFGAKTWHFAAEYKLTDDLLWLIGLHVADGSAQLRNHGTGSLVISLGTDETEIQQRAVRVIRDTFGIEPTVRPAWGGKRAVNITANSLPLVAWFREMCGVKNTKRFPSWAFGLTTQQTAALVEGWMDGDGCTDAVRTLGVSAYRHLQESAAWLIRRAGGITSVFAGRAEMEKGWTGGSVTTVKTPRRVCAADQGGYWAEVRSVNHHQITATVYNLEVEGDNSYCVPVAVHNCDRLYAPMILATLGIDNMGDGEPWIPDQGDLEDLRDDIQSALAADFKLLCHNFGLTITSVFGRESVPRFDQDYERVDAMLMQSWGIGQALIMGGTGAGGTYASSAINREVCEQLMKSAQNKVIRHMRKRMEVIAEAQEHYDFELKGGVRKPVYREIVEFNEETGEEEIVRVPKLLIPDVKFATLNLRDEATERAFVSQLKQLGVPVSDKTLSINIPFEFKEELERASQETVDKGNAQSDSMAKLQKMLDEKGQAYPAELVQFLSATLELRSALAQTELAESQNKMMDQQLAQTSPAGMMGLLPGTTMQPIAGSAQAGPLGGAPPPSGSSGEETEDAGQEASEQKPGATADPTLGAGAPAAAAPQQIAATMHGPRMHNLKVFPPGGEVEKPEFDVQHPEIPRNRARPEESDEKRSDQPRKARKKVTALPGRGEPDPVIVNSRFSKGPSSYGRSRTADERRVERAIRRREMLAKGAPTVEQLVMDPETYALTNMGAHMSELQADLPELLAGGGSPDSRRLLGELIEQYEEITGVTARG